MLTLLFTGLFVTLGLVGLRLSVARVRERGRVWTQAAASVGLTDLVLRQPFIGSQTLLARAGRFEIRIDSQARDRDAEDTRVALVDSKGAFGALSIRREQGMELAKLFGTSEIELGDTGFDGAFFVGGPPALVYSFLDNPTRAILFRLNEEGSVQVTSTAICAQFLEGDEERLLPFTLRSLIALGERLVRRTETAVRLAANARDDPYPGVRLSNLRCLIREFGEDPVVDGTLRAACSDRSAEIRIQAATALGDDGLDTLMAMADDMGLGDAWSAAAVTALGRRFSFEAAEATLDRALHGRRFETARACIEVLGSTNEAAIEPLVRALEVEASLVPAAAARALGSLRAAAAEAPLIRALRGDAPGLRLAAAEALGRCGSVAAVAPLRGAAERHSESAFRRAVRQAVAEIQARQPGASPGQLSLVVTEAGQLSLAGAETGQLSFPAAERGQLSISPEKQREGR